MVSNSFDAIITFNEERTVTSFNAAAERLFACPARESEGLPLARFLPGENGAEGLAGHSGSHGPYELLARAGDRLFPVEVACSTMRIEAEWVGIAAVRDITERKAQQAKLVHQAMHDALTGLANRTLLRWWRQRRPAAGDSRGRASCACDSLLRRADALVANRQSVTLDQGRVSVVSEFRQLLDDQTPEALERAIGLYRGDLLDGIQVRGAAFEDWLLVERQRLRALAIEAATRLMMQSLAAGSRDRAATAARRLLFLEPLHETACRTLMQAHADRGERAQGLKLFENLRDRLRQELGVRPEPDTVELYQSIRGGRPGEVSPGAGSAGRSRDGGPQPRAIEGFAERAAGDGQSPGEASSKPSIAVLPFTNIGGDPEQDYFADGLAEDIITDLSRISALFVAARHTVFTLKGRAVQVQQAARELNVSHVLEGSVRKAGGRVRISAQLIDGATGGHLWANHYDRGLNDIFALQDEITGSIVETLKVKLLPEELQGIASHSTTNVDAYQYYLMGRSFYLQGIDKHSLRIAREMFAKAIEIDPRYAGAYAAIAICELYLSMGDPNATYESSLANSLRALEIDPLLAEAYAVKGLALYADGRYVEATPEFERGLRLGPNLFETHFFYARNCRLQGLHEQAAALFKRAATLRSNDFRSLGLLAEAYKALGRRDDLMVAARQCLGRVEAEVEAHPDNAGALCVRQRGSGRARPGDARQGMGGSGQHDCSGRLPGALQRGPHLCHSRRARHRAGLPRAGLSLVRRVATPPVAVDEERPGHRSPARSPKVPPPPAAARGHPRPGA